MNSWSSYPKIFNIGHSAIRDLFSVPVTVEEKVDGSQFSFGIFDGELRCRSKGKELVLDAPEKMFTKAVETVKELAPMLRNGWTYRAEYLQTKAHNCLDYSRTPNNHLILFDVCTGLEQYLDYEQKAEEAQRLGLEVVPLLFRGKINAAGAFRELLERESILGGAKIEGVVIKQYELFGADKKVLLGKYVSEAFKEAHAKSWGEKNPNKGDFLHELAECYRTEARWKKAVQRLKETETHTQSPKDIGQLIKDVQLDVQQECIDEIKEQLWNWVKEDILRKSVSGLAQWYKDELVKEQFKEAK